MRAAWYDRQGPAAEVLQVGSLPDPIAGPGEVVVRVSLSGVNPGDTKKRRGWTGSAMPYERVVPHSDAAGVIESVGEGIDPARVGTRVWVHGAQSYRPLGTAAELAAVPSDQAIDLPEGVSDELGACLGIPGITAHRAVFGDGDVRGQTVLVHGALGAVGSVAAQLALWGGAQVIGTVRSAGDVARATERLAPLGGAVVALDGDTDESVARIRALAPDGVDRIVEVSFSDNADLDARLVRNGAVIAAYATRSDRPSFAFWPMLFDNVTLRLLGSDDFPPEAKRAAAADLTLAAAEGALRIDTLPPLSLEEVAAAHDAVDAGSKQRVLVDPRR